MFVIPGQYGKDNCDGYSRRELLRVGGASLMGLSLPTLLKHEKVHAAEEARYGGVGYGKAKHVILVYLQGDQVTSTCGIRSPMFLTTSKVSLGRSTPNCTAFSSLS